MDSTELAAYLERIGLGRLERRPAPTVAVLRMLHAAHVERVTYETLDRHMGCWSPLDDSVARVLRGRGGSCYQLNAAFAALLAAVGFRVAWHLAGMQTTPHAPPIVDGNHVVLTVRCEEEDWLVDVGSGDALYEPLPVRRGGCEQGPVRLRLERSPVGRDCWQLLHGPHGSFHAMHFSMARIGYLRAAEEHDRQRTDFNLRFRRPATVMRRDRTQLYLLRGCAPRHTDARGSTKHVLTRESDWFDTLHQLFGLPPRLLGTARTRTLWERVYARHEAWIRAQQSAG